MKNRQALLILHLANTLSGIAQGITMLAIPWYFVRIAEQETLFGKVLLVVTFLSMIWGIYAGTIIDSSNRRDLFSRVNLTGFIVLIFLSLASQFIPESHLLWGGLAFATTVFIYNIHFPNLYALAQEITEREHYRAVISQLEIQGQLTFTLAGGFAAILLSGIPGQFNLLGLSLDLPIQLRALTLSELLYLNAAAYLVTVVLFQFVRFESITPREYEPENIRQRLAKGFSYLWERRAIFYFGNLSLLLFVCILVEGLYVLPTFVHSFLGAEGDVYAQSDMAFSIGALLAGFLTTKVFSPQKPLTGIISLMIIGGLLFMSFPQHQNIPLFYFTNFLIGACNAAIRIQRVSFIFSHVDNQVIGRVNSVWFMLSVVIRLLTIAIVSMPFFHEKSQIQYAMYVLGGICLSGALGLLFLLPKLNRQTAA